MPSDDLAVIADQHRIGEAEPLDAVGDLPDLLFGVSPGIAGVRPQGATSIDERMGLLKCSKDIWRPLGCLTGGTHVRTSWL
jgi:hypothetical protein